MGNLSSVDKALRRVGGEVVVTREPQAIAEAAGVVLPGVGAFDDCMAGLIEYGLVEVLKEVISQGKPFLGICLGLQVLFDRSEEGSRPGLGIIPGQVVRFTHNLKIPQIGWNQISIQQAAPHLAGIDEGEWVYFVHSYYVVPEDESLVATTTDYGYEFCSSVWRENIFACQFHPEKSQDTGLKILDNFRQLVEEASSG